MPLLDKIQKDMVDAMKAKEEARLGALRMIKAALKKHEVDSMKPLNEATEMQVMSTLIKQRRESADMFRKGGREELAVLEEAEIRIIESYLPATASPEEMEEAVAAAISETGATSSKQMGLVMKAAQGRLAGKRVEGKELSELVKKKLTPAS
ncbi:MAG TPA: GatB/YqeY domain-containing protein [Bryobacteraceae bacterium]|nr:GatB/YqeY domain-containing protein [Bryobacteraceae bacterium]